MYEECEGCCEQLSIPTKLIRTSQSIYSMGIRLGNEGSLLMIVEVAMLQVKSGKGAKFVEDFKKASRIISSMKGYIHHELQKCLEVEDKYMLLARWEALEDHTEGFRKSEQYQAWKEMLHHYYDPFPIVEHYEGIDLS